MREFAAPRPGGDAHSPGTSIPSAEQRRGDVDRACVFPQAGPRGKGPWMRWRPVFKSPRVLLAALAGLGLLSALVGYAGVEPVLRRATRFDPSSLLLLGALMVAYEAVRAVQWILLLRALIPAPPWRMAAMAYLGGELVKGFPAGQYAQTLLLRRAGGTPLVDSVAAMWVILWIEAAMCFLVVGLLGSIPWPWLRPVAWGLLGGVGAVICVVRGHGAGELRARARLPRGRLGALRWWGDGIIATTQSLLRLRGIGPTVLCSALYVGIAGLALSAIAHALGVPGVGPRQGIVIYAFALAANLVILVPFDVGLIETAGAAALMASGSPKATAVAIMLMHRVLCGVLTAGLTTIGLVVLRRQVRAALHSQARSDPGDTPI